MIAGAKEPELLRRDADGVAWLTLNRPRERNALSVSLMTALDAALVAISADPSVLVVVIGGAGAGFCAGHDMRELRSNVDLPQLFSLCSQLMLRIVGLRQPVIAMVHGIASAAGCQLVATCDLAVATETARFSTPGVNIGLFCSTPMVALSRAVGRKAAMEFLLTGDLIGAEQARAIGLINRVTADAELEGVVAALAGQIASKSPLALSIGKAAFYRQADMPLPEAYRFAAEVMVRNMRGDDAAEGIDAFLDKRDPVWTGR
ncbi:MAG: enoyl-CoA hydratase [Acetobacteraceae bacterium]|nr:enoyl-CoA hydratase [Acetobacteraceae bacterium]MSP30663.1 enoyl-CoA hydratase [Acetobacteraceae bacterium]